MYLKLSFFVTLPDLLNIITLHLSILRDGPFNFRGGGVSLKKYSDFGGGIIK
jgi:hypothetical protein